MAGLPKKSGGLFGAITKIFDKNEKEIDLLRPTIDAINKLSDSYSDLSDEDIKERAANQKKYFRDEVTKRLQQMKDPKTGEAFEWQELSTEISWSDEYHTARRAVEAKVLDEMLPEAFALVREAGARTIGLRHFDVQLLGGAVLHSGRIAEMRTGEGKTLVATSPAYLNALSGRGVHIVTVNDYLAERDANWMRPIYEFLGLKVSFLTNDMQPEQRIPAYQCDILYATNSEVGFDYLRDNMAHSAEQVVQRPPNYAIVDEVDNILIDEARTPLIISAQVAKTERAMRRQELAKVVDKVARQMMPAGTDREVEILQASVTHKGRINIGGILSEIEKQGSFEQATNYLIDSYLIAEKSARVNNAAHLLDVADELAEQKLIDHEGHSYLSHLAASAVSSERLRSTWRSQMERIAEPFAKAWIECRENNFARPAIDELLENILALPEESAAELPEMLQGDNMPGQVAAVIAEELMQRAYIVPEEMGNMAHIIAEQTGDLSATRSVLVDAILDSAGALQDAEAVLADSVPEDATKVLSSDEVRTVINALEEIGRKGLLPFDVLEELWQSVALTQDPAALRRELSQTIQGHGDASAQQILKIASSFSDSREAFLAEQSDILATTLQGYEPVIAKARKGESDDVLRKALQSELSKKGAMADAAKLVRQFNKDRHQAHGQLSGHLAEEMAQWVDVPRDAKKTLTEILDEGGTQQELRERLMVAVRDYPGENSEQSALIGEMLRQLQQWRLENGAALTDTLTDSMQLSEAGATSIREGAEIGLPSEAFEQLVNEQLLLTPQVAPLTNAVETFSERWQDHQQQQIQQALQELGNTVELSTDAQESLTTLFSAPPAKALDVAIFDVLAEDSASRHLEARLSSENAVAFCDEVQRRIPLAKEVQKKLQPKEFEGRTAAQLQRALWKLIQRSLEVMPVDDYKPLLKNLIWLSEKDERRRASSATDMGTLIAEREAGSPIFGEPENFLESLLGNDILTDAEAMLLRRAQAELPDGANATITSLVDKVLRLPAERRRRLSEAKLQEIQPILDQGIKAHALFEREVNYVIDLGDEGRREIVIVDEFTGRKMPGRRYSEGLHEALEAKHGLEVQLESQTVATITIQNYFRLYNKLSGMTGTAKTEEEEFAKTYGIEVVSIPTNRPIQRQDAPDVVYKTMEAKFRALTIDVLERHCMSKPVLVGTRSVEMSESTSERLKAQPLQALMLIQLIKYKLDSDKALPEAEKNKILEATRGPILQLPLASVKSLAKMAGVNPDPLSEENITLLLQQFEGEDISRERLEIALKTGLPHSVLNAKNHRNEARIVAEAARPGAVTIATNMAGRGVDIVLGGSLDVESRWRITTLQVLAKQLQRTSIAVRSRNQQTTDILISRFDPEMLQQLAWVTAVKQQVDELEKTGQLKGQAIKEIRDALGQELTAKDLVSKVRSRARRIGIEDQLPLEAKPLQDNEPADAIARDLELYTKSTFSADQIRAALQSGISYSASGRDLGQTLVLNALTRPMTAARTSTAKLLEILSTMPDLDRALLQAAAESGAERGADFNAEQIANSIGDVTIDWVTSRLKTLAIHDAPSAKHKLDNYNDDEAEINELQLARLLGDLNIGIQWIRERLNGWKLTKEGRAYDATPEQQQIVTDSALVHYRLNRVLAKSLWEDWKNDPVKQREMTLVEVPNLVLAGDMANMVGTNEGPFMDPHWLHAQFESLGLIQSENDFFEAQMSAQSNDGKGGVQEVPINVVVYRMALPKVLLALDATLQEAILKVGSDAADVRKYLEHNDPWALELIDQSWLDERLPLLQSGEITVSSSTTALIETGVSGQSADIVLEGEPRPEDIAHTSEQEQVLALGGLQILGTERHESRRIDNQLRGRAGRQGDPGYSRFYLSLEDELWRLFGARGQWLLNKWDEDEPVEAKMISKSIENAQKKVELNHFESRKQVLKYDDVMNVQREVIYRERRRALMGEDLRDTTLDMVHQTVLAEADKHCPSGISYEEWDTHRLHLALGRLLGSSLLARHLKADQLASIQEREHLDELLHEVATACFEDREKQMTPEYMRTIERWQLMRSIDAYWMEHLAEMDYLRDSIWHEGYAQKDPVGAYKHEGFQLFQKTLSDIRAEVTEQIFNLQLQSSHLEDNSVQMQGMQEERIAAALPADEDGFDDGVDLHKDADGEPTVRVAAASPNSGATGAPKAGRNDPCPCGSGKKYKKCCLPKEQGVLV